MSNWYANRLANQTPPPVSARAEPNPPPPVRPTYQRPAPEAVVEDLCPSCSSGNYMSPPNSKYKRCYDCGYPIVQAGSGVGSIKSDAPTKPSTQVRGEGFNPKQIVGRVE